MKRIPASQLTQAHYGQQVRFATLGHVHVEPPWVIIRAKGAGAWDAYRVRADSIVEVRE